MEGSGSFWLPKEGISVRVLEDFSFDYRAATQFWRSKVLQLAKDFPEYTFAIADEDDYAREVKDLGLSETGEDINAAILDESRKKFAMEPEECDSDTLCEFVTAFKSEMFKLRALLLYYWDTSIRRPSSATLANDWKLESLDTVHLGSTCLHSNDLLALASKACQCHKGKDLTRVDKGPQQQNRFFPQWKLETFDYDLQKKALLKFGAAGRPVKQEIQLGSKRLGASDSPGIRVEYSSGSWKSSPGGRSLPLLSWVQHNGKQNVSPALNEHCVTEMTEISFWRKLKPTVTVKQRLKIKLNGENNAYRNSHVEHVRIFLATAAPDSTNAKLQLAIPPVCLNSAHVQCLSYNELPPPF
ncbi:hypothetical protein P7K49_029732 [Saguinus oedipus]|uniref:Uncharacterized protein n=1 Tax=Saguinus oedipus TaxID=9490 RepID=A0ABQ9U994_SAGOE|nr:hypothetical protein P7K49_029732 [Saguinus oedipus]